MNGRVQAIFEDITDLPHEQRTAYLDRVCGKDDALRSEVESLLRAHEEAGAFLNSPTAGPTAFHQATSPSDADSSTVTPTERRRASVPEQVGPVRLVREIGRGGMGCVWLGRHELLQRDVAVKFVLNIAASADSKAVELFLEGARAAAAVKHPGLTAVHHADVTGDVPYLVMDYIDGGSLSDVIKQHGPLSVQQVAAIVHASCDVLAALHDAEIVHRDIKPSNILIGHDGHLYLTDFGLACERVPQGRSVRVKGLMGTPQYMAPEMFDGVISPRTDIYSLGVTTYELLTGNTPFSSESEIKREGSARELPRTELEARGVPEAFIDLIERMTNPTAMFRLKSARQVQQLLKRAADAPTTQNETLLTGLLSQERSTAKQDGKIEGDADSSSTNLTVLADRKRKSSAERHAELDAKPDGASCAAHSTPGDRSTDTLNVEEAVVPTSVPCLRCEYDLNGSSIKNACPECGTAMSENLSSRRIIFAPRQWLQSMQQGCRGISWAFTGLLGMVVAFITAPLVIGGLEWSAERSATVTIDRAAPPLSTLITLLQTLGFLLTTALVALLLISTWKATQPAEHDRTTVAMRLFRAVRPIAAAVTALWAVALVIFLWSVSAGSPSGSMTPFAVVLALAFAGTLLWMLFLMPRLYLIGRELHLTTYELFRPAKSFHNLGSFYLVALVGTFAAIGVPVGFAITVSHMRLLEQYPWIEGTFIEFSIGTLATLVFIGFIVMCSPFVELPLAIARRLERALANHDRAMVAHRAYRRATGRSDSKNRPVGVPAGSAHHRASVADSAGTHRCEGRNMGTSTTWRLDPDIAAHYKVADERGRLSADARGQLEFERTRELIERFLPPAPARVLDVGGGPGAYARCLAAAGYYVELIDPVPMHVEQAREVSRRATHPFRVALGDARALPAPDRSVHAVLLLGPLYHLDPGGRARALGEAARVLHPAGVVVAGVISQFASLLDGLREGWLVDEALAAIVERDLATGQHCNPDAAGRPSWFTNAWFHRPGELRDELEAAGLRVDALVAVEGPAWLLGDLDERWHDDPQRRRILDAVRAIERESCMLGISAHLVAIARHSAPHGASPRDALQR